MNKQAKKSGVAHGKLQPLVRSFNSKDFGLKPIIVEGWDNNLMEVHCPVCGMENVHHEDCAETILSQDDYSASNRVRGSVVAIQMWCEEGHRFVMCIGFHKGSVVMWGIPNK